MYFSRFNYLSAYEKDDQRLLMNFLSQSCDIVDSESASHFSEKKGIPPEEKKYALQRGYVFQDESDESMILQKLYHHELQKKRTLPVIHLDRSHDKKVKEQVKKIQTHHDRFILLSEHLLDTPLQGDHWDTAPIPHIITVEENLPVLDSFLAHHAVSKLSVIVSLTDSAGITGESESRLDSLMEQGTPVEIIVRTQEDTEIDALTSLMNYFIYKGWPFLEHFTCTLEPWPNKGCLFGRWYGTPHLAHLIYEEYAAHPQTEFCSMHNWVGVNPIHSIIWTGKVSPPSFHFCDASRGLTVLREDYEIPCPYMDTEEMENTPDCQRCTYVLICGGGCPLPSRSKKEDRCPPVKELLETSLEFYFDEFLRRIAFHEQYYGGMQ